jgi:DNA-binding NarL/FixJ family response regulator
VTITILIADDQALIRSGLRAIIESEPGMRVVGEAGDGAEAVEAVRRLRPHVALMDIRMPRLDGVAATRALLRGGAPVPTKVLILTTFHLDAYVTEALRAGASGFLLKEATADQLIEAVRVIASGEAILAPSVTRRLLETMAVGSTGDGGKQIRDQLSVREVDVLLLVARGLSNAEIGAQLHLAETTVKSHVQSMLGKLGVRDRLQAAVAAYDAGLVQPGGLSSQDCPLAPGLDARPPIRCFWLRRRRVPRSGSYAPGGPCTLGATWDGSGVDAWFSLA